MVTNEFAYGVLDPVFTPSTIFQRLFDEVFLGV